MLRQQQIDDLVEAVQAAAAKEIAPRFRALSANEIETKSGALDLVTIADRAAEEAIRRAVGRILPGAAFVGEESVAENPALLDAIGASDTAVIVDPIDGTGNYVAGLAVFGTILAVVENGRTVFGLLFDPVMEDWMFALRDEGAYFRRRDGTCLRIATRGDRDLAAASGFVALQDYSVPDRRTVLRGFEPVQQIRDIRCSCHEYRLLVSGHADFIRSSALKPWDHAAGLLLLDEAGGWSAIDGETPYAPTIHAGGIIAASCEQMGRRISGLAAGLP